MVLPLIKNEINRKPDKKISIKEIIEKELKDLRQGISILQERIEELEKRLKTFSSYSSLLSILRSL
jgi:prefoldin subunit 5